MPISAEVQKWFDGLKAVGLTDDQIKPMLDLVQNDKVDGYIKGTVMAQSDYTRGVQTLKELEKKEKDELAKSVEHQNRLTAWQQEETKKGQLAVAAREKAEAALAATQARIKSLKEQGYVTDEMFQGIELTPAALAAAPVTQPVNGEAKYLTQDAWNAGARNLVEVGDELAVLREEHNRVFAGVENAPRFDRQKILEYMDDPKNRMRGDTAAERIRNVWLSVYPVEDRRTAMREADVQKRIEQGAEDLYKKRVSQDIQAGKPVSAAPQPSVMRKIAGTANNSVGNAALRRNERINKAVAELATKT